MFPQKAKMIISFDHFLDWMSIWALDVPTLLGIQLPFQNLFDIYDHTVEGCWIYGS